MTIERIVLLVIPAAVLLMFVLAFPREDQNRDQVVVEQSKSSEFTPRAGAYLRTIPLTGADRGVGIGVELAPGVHLDMGTGNINFGPGF